MSLPRRVQGAWKKLIADLLTILRHIRQGTKVVEDRFQAITVTGRQDGLRLLDFSLIDDKETSLHRLSPPIW